MLSSFHGSRRRSVVGRFLPSLLLRWLDRLWFGLLCFFVLRLGFFRKVGFKIPLRDHDPKIDLFILPPNIIEVFFLIHIRLFILVLISETVRYIKDHGKELVYDAEHFFDGYIANPDYAL